MKHRLVMYGAVQMNFLHPFSNDDDVCRVCVNKKYVILYTILNHTILSEQNFLFTPH
jgi:hypothetical protein